MMGVTLAASASPGHALEVRLHGGIGRIFVVVSELNDDPITGALRRRRGHGFSPSAKCFSEHHGVERGKQSAEGVVRRHATIQIKERLEPFVAAHRAHDHHVLQPVPGNSLAVIGRRLTQDTGDCAFLPVPRGRANSSVSFRKRGPLTRCWGTSCGGVPG
jgi:hypothetical protein